MSEGQFPYPMYQHPMMGSMNQPIQHSQGQPNFYQQYYDSRYPYPQMPIMVMPGMMPNFMMVPQMPMNYPPQPPPIRKKKFNVKAAAFVPQSGKKEDEKEEEKEEENFEIIESIKLPLIFGDTEEHFLVQRKKYHKLREIKRLEKKEIKIAWSTIALEGSKKNTPKQPPKPKEDKVITSNVLEPLGIVILRYMFDKNFQTIPSPKIIPRGLVNTGNICFMSSILQMLLYCQPFYKALNIISHKTVQSLTSHQTPLFDALCELYSQFNVESDTEIGNSITPTDFYKSISKNERFQHLQWGQQEDAEEFFGYLLDGLNEEFTSSVLRLNDQEIKGLMASVDSETKQLIKTNLKKFHEGDFNSSETRGRSDSLDDGWQEVGVKKTAKRTVEVKPSPIRLLFGGQFRSVLTIPNSKDSTSITLDPFQQIQLDISDDSTKTLEDAFAKLSEVEEIPYNSSDGEVLAKKQTFIDKFPEVLVVHLKRFSFVNHRRIEKLRKKIAYSHDLRIPDECISSKKFIKDVHYKLVAVVYHHGISSDGGHYTVDVLKDEDKWLRIDDVTITNLTSNEVLNGENDNVKTAYILMYQKV